MTERIRVEIEGESGDLQRAALAAKAAIKSVGDETRRQDKVHRDANGRLRDSRGRYVSLAQAANQARDSVAAVGDEVDRQDGVWRDQNGRLRDARGRFVAMGRAADDSSRSVMGLGRSIGSVNRQATLLRNAIALVKWPAFIAGAGLATQAASALAAAAIGLTGALAPATGALAAVPAAASAAAQGLGTVALAASGVTDALKAATNAQTSAARDGVAAMDRQRSAANQVRQAKLSLAQAQRTARFAQEDLTEARRDATRQLDDMRRAADRSRLSEARAVLSVREAQAELRRVMGDPAASALDVDDARLRVREARADLDDIRAQSARDRADYARARAGGVRGMPQMVAAQRAAADAQRAVTESARQMRDAVADAASATSQGSAAANAYADALANLSPAARHFVETLLDYKPLLDDLQATAAEGLFPGVERGLAQAVRNADVVKRVTGDTARTLGALAEKGGAWLGSDAVGRDLEIQGERNRVTIQRLGLASIYLADALRHVTIEAGPLVDWMTTGVVHLARFVDEEARAGRETGKLREFFRETRWVLEQLGGILGHTAGALFDIGSAAKPLGQDILVALRDAAEGWHEWTSSVEGQNELRDYFTDAKPAIFEAGRLARDAAKSIARLGADPELAPLLEKLRVDLLPALEQLFDTMTRAFAPHLVDALVDVVDLIATMAEETGPLTVFVDAIGFLARSLDALLESNPGLRSALVMLAGATAIIKAMQFGAAIAGVKALSGAWQGVATWAGRARDASLAAGSAQPSARAPGAAGGVWRDQNGRLRDAGGRFVAVGGGAATGAAGGAGGGRGGVGGTGLFAAGSRAGPIALILALGAIAQMGIAGELAKLDTGSKALDRLNDEAAKTPGILGPLKFSLEEVDDAAGELGISLDDIIDKLPRINPVDRLTGAIDFAKLKSDAALFGGELKRIQAQLTGQRVAFDFGLALRVDPKHARQAVDKLVGEIKELEPGAQGAAKRAALAMIDELHKGGSLSKDKATRLKRLVIREIDEMRVGVKEKSRKTAEQAWSNLALLGDVVAASMGNLIDDVNSALKALGVGPVKWSSKGTKRAITAGIQALSGNFAGAAQTALGNARGGLHQIGKAGDRGRDTIPMNIAGQQVVVGSGEQVAVLNRDQQAALNERLADVGGLPGFFRRPWKPHYMATGGIVPIPGEPGESIHRSILRDVVLLKRKYRLDITDGYAASGHAAAGEHPKGLAIDAVPGAGGSWDLVDQLAKWAEPIQNRPRHPFRWVGYTGDANHGRGNHLHLSWLAGQTLGGAANMSVLGEFLAKRVKVGGPRGAARDLAEAALNKVARATEKHYAEADPGLGDLGALGQGGALAGGGWSKARIKALWVQAGGNPAMANLAAAVALAESSGNPNATSHNPVSGGRNLGLWQIDAGSHPDASLDPLANAQAAVRISGNGRNWRAWEAFTNGRYAQYLARGGLLALAAGGLFAGARGKTDPKAKSKSKPRARRPTRRLSERVKQLAKLKHTLNLDITKPMDSVWTGAEQRISDLDGGGPEGLDHLESMVSRLRPEYVVDHDDNPDTDEIVNQSGVTLPDGRFVPGIDQAVALFNQMLGNRGQVRAALEAQQTAAKIALAHVVAALGERQRIWEQIAAKVRKQAERIAELKRKLRDLAKRRKAINDRQERIERKRQKTSGDRAELRRLMAEERSLNREARDITTELHGTQRAQRALTKQDEFDVAQINEYADEDSPLGRARAAITEAEGERETWRERARGLPTAFTVLDDQIQGDIMLRIQDATGTKPPKPSRSGLDPSVLKDLQIESLRNQLANTRLQLSQQGVFNNFRPQLIGGLGGFAKGTWRVASTGLAIIHKDEAILSDPEGPHGSQFGGHRNQIPVGRDAPQVTVVIDGDVGPLIRHVKVMVDGVEQRVNARVGREGRQLANAPGGWR